MPSSSSSNSIVPAPTVLDRRRQPRRRPRPCAARSVWRHRRARAPPRSASGAGAAPSNRARRDGPHGRACRPGPGSRRAAAAPGTSRRRRRRCRRPTAPRSAPARRAGANCSASVATRIPLPPPPAVALMMTGKPISSATASASSASLTMPGDPGHRRHAGLLREATRRGLVTHRADLVARGADEGDVRGPAGIGELGVLGEESVPRVDRVRAGDLGGGDQARDPR